MDEIRAIIEANRADLRNRFMVGSIGVFGSCVRGEQSEGSDIDVLVEFDGDVSMFEFMDLQEHLAALLGARVDLVTKNALKPYIGKRILEEVQYV